jgi:hypothetical protein
MLKRVTRYESKEEEKVGRQARLEKILARPNKTVSAVFEIQVH